MRIRTGLEQSPNAVLSDCTSPLSLRRNGHLSILDIASVVASRIFVDWINEGNRANIYNDTMPGHHLAPSASYSPRSGCGSETSRQRTRFHFIFPGRFFIFMLFPLSRFCFEHFVLRSDVVHPRSSRSNLVPLRSGESRFTSLIIEEFTSSCSL